MDFTDEGCDSVRVNWGCDSSDMELPDAGWDSGSLSTGYTDTLYRQQLRRPSVWCVTFMYVKGEEGRDEGVTWRPLHWRKE